MLFVIEVLEQEGKKEGIGRKEKKKRNSEGIFCMS